MTGPAALRPSPLAAAPEALGVALPAGSLLRADDDTRVLEGGRVVVGGRPLRVLRLTPGGAALVARWHPWGWVGQGRAERLLARRLVHAGLFVARPEGTTFDESDVTVVVPVRNRPDQLRRVLGALGGLRIVVVDDASTDRAAVAAAARDAGATLVALDEHVGPGAARNAGMSRVTSRLVALVDSDCLPSPGWLGPLLAHFDDPTVAAVAPRIVSDGTANWIGRYERARPPLDRGPRHGLVGPRAHVPFVPTAALVLRADLGRPTCFDETLPGGEDVDLVWRLVAAGWSVRYVPSATVAHAARQRWQAWLAQRFDYGTTAAPLWVRHPGAVPPVRIPASSALVALLALVGRPVLAGAAAAGSAGALALRLNATVQHPVRLSIRLTARSMVAIPGGVAAGLARAWGPALVAMLGWHRTRRVAAAVLVAPALKDWASTPEAPNPLGYVVTHVLDDLAYGAGVWAGCVRARVLGPLVPQIVRGGARSPAPRRSALLRTRRAGLEQEGALIPGGSRPARSSRRADRHSPPAPTPGRTRG